MVSLMYGREMPSAELPEMWPGLRGSWRCLSLFPFENRAMAPSSSILKRGRPLFAVSEETAGENVLEN